ncbi:MAG: hypothetical protein LUO89_12540 [Methanothrix sp.]|nr:hypothetical protein [Methanothrix sp.]
MSASRRLPLGTDPRRASRRSVGLSRSLVPRRRSVYDERVIVPVTEPAHENRDPGRNRSRDDQQQRPIDQPEHA